ncbi:MAG: hypothetical protein WCW17_02880 [Patescibacteria group bacterium]|jgi:hypothetical protein
MDYQTRFARITNLGKLQDRFLSSQINQPTTPDLINKGNLYLLVEIKNPWVNAAQIGQVIINTLLRYYYKSEDSSNLTNFEYSLKKVNEALAQMTQNGETDWIGNLNAILVLNCDNDLHIAQTGSTNAFLIRNNSINDLSFSTENRETHPLKTFSNIASGNIESNDKIFISNSEIIRFIPREKLEHIVKTLTPKEGIFEIAKILKKQKIKNINAIILETLDKNSSENAILEDFPDTIYLDQPLESYLVTSKKIYNTHIKPNAIKLGKMTASGSKKITHFLKTKALPLVMKISKITGKKIGETSSKTGEKFSPILDKIKPKGRDQIIPNEKKYVVSHYADPKWKKIISKIYRWLINHPKYLYGIVATISIIIVICLIFNNKSSKGDDQANKNESITQIEQLLTDADKMLVFNETQKAVDLLVQAKTLISESNISDSNKKDELSAKTDELIAKSINAKILTFSKNSNYTGSDSIFIYNNKVIGFNNKTNSTIEPDLKNEPTSKIILTGSTTPARAIYFDGTDTLFIETGQNEIYSYNLKTSSSIKIESTTGWVQAANILQYGKNLYLIDALNNTIVKYAATSSTKYGDAFQYITDKTTLSDPISWDVDGQIFILEKSGDVIQYAKGKKTNFTITGIPAPYDHIYSGLKIFATENSSDLYIVDGGEKDTIGPRIIKFDKNGKFVSQYLFPSNTTNIKDIFIQSSSKKVWVLNDTQVLETTLE